MWVCVDCGNTCGFGSCNACGGEALWTSEGSRYKATAVAAKANAPVAAAGTNHGDDPLAEQVGGDHYKGMTIQPIEYIHANKLGFCEGAVIKYVSRWPSKGGIDDLRKAKHILELLIKLEERKG